MKFDENQYSSMITFFIISPNFPSSNFTIYMQIEFILDGIIFPSIQILCHQQVYHTLNNKIKN